MGGADRKGKAQTYQHSENIQIILARHAMRGTAKLKISKFYRLISFWFSIGMLTGYRCRVGNTSVYKLGGPGFKSRLGNRRS